MQAKLHIIDEIESVRARTAVGAAGPPRRGPGHLHRESPDHHRPEAVACRPLRRVAQVTRLRREAAALKAEYEARGPARGDRDSALRSCGRTAPRRAGRRPSAGRLLRCRATSCASPSICARTATRAWCTRAVSCATRWTSTRRCAPRSRRPRSTWRRPRPRSSTDTPSSPRRTFPRVRPCPTSPWSRSRPSSPAMLCGLLLAVLADVCDGPRCSSAGRSSGCSSAPSSGRSRCPTKSSA